VSITSTELYFEVDEDEAEFRKIDTEVSVFDDGHFVGVRCVTSSLSAFGEEPTRCGTPSSAVVVPSEDIT
jgi:hypothetical protein